MKIDAVVTWVDGSDPVHAEKMADWRDRSGHGPRLHAKATTAHRFKDDRELVYCLRSLRRHAPWLRTIWVVTDNQRAAYIDWKVAEEHGIRIVDHSHIFRGLEELLPTFNSMAIESLIWRIEGLAEHFIFFNDDMFLAHNLNTGDFFKRDKAAIRGKFVDWTVRKLSTHHEKAQANAAKLANVDTSNAFVEAHGPHPLMKSVMQTLYEEYHYSFIKNAALKFRTNTRVAPVTLFNHRMINLDRALVRTGRRIVYITAKACETRDLAYLRSRLDKIHHPLIAMFCINAFGALRERLPEADERMVAIVGPAQPWEREDALTR